MKKYEEEEVFGREFCNYSREQQQGAQRTAAESTRAAAWKGKRKEERGRMRLKEGVRGFKDFTSTSCLMPDMTLEYSQS